MMEEQLRDNLSRFGSIDQVKIVRDKNIDFVHFLSISTATKVITTLPTEPTWVGKCVNYGKDHCAYVPKSQQAATAAVQVAATQSLVAQSTAASLQSFPHSPFSPYPEMPTTPAGTAMLASMAAGGPQRHCCQRTLSYVIIRIKMLINWAFFPLLIYIPEPVTSLF